MKIAFVLLGCINLLIWAFGWFSKKFESKLICNLILGIWALEISRRM